MFKGIIKGTFSGIAKTIRFIFSKFLKYITVAKFAWELRKMSKLIQKRAVIRSESHNDYNNEIN